MQKCFSSNRCVKSATYVSTLAQMEYANNYIQAVLDTCSTVCTYMYVHAMYTYVCVVCMYISGTPKCGHPVLLCIHHNVLGTHDITMYVFHSNNIIRNYVISVHKRGSTLLTNVHP